MTGQASPSWRFALPAIVIGICLIMSSARAQQANVEAETAQPFASAREMLETMGVDQSHFDLLVDGQPLDLNEQEPLLRILFALRKSPQSEIVRFARDGFRLPASGDESGALRGEIFRLSGHVTRVTEEKPLAEVVDRYEMKRYYRCQATLAGGKRATVFALTIPQAWPRDQDFSERFSCAGLYLKLGAPAEEELPMPIFATQRLAWHAEGLLGDLGMDAGLFDTVQNKTPIRAEERECFFDLLYAAGRVNPQELFALTDRAPGEDYSVIPLFNEPDKQHGKLVALTGTARRAILVKLDPETEAEEIRRLGIDHYYQVEIFTGDSQSNPLVFCVRELPPDMPRGPHIYETVRIPGFFFKTWAYRLQRLEGQQEQGHQLAPLLVGNQLRWTPADTSRNPWIGAISGGLFIVVMLVGWLGITAYNRSDRKFHKRVMTKQFEPEEGKSLNDLKLDVQDKPDFTKLP